MLQGHPEHSARLLRDLQAAIPSGHDIRVDDRQARTAVLSVEGPLAPAVIANAISHLLAPRLAEGMNVEFEFAGYKALAWRCANLTPSGISFLLAPMPALHAWEQLLAAGAVPAGLHAWEGRRPDLAGQDPRAAGLRALLVPEGRDFRGRAALFGGQEASG